MTLFRTWMALTIDATLLGLETQRVIGLRMLKVAAGGAAAEAEALRMVTEKVAAMAEATAALAAGSSPQAVMRRWRTHVRANERRLSRPRKKR